MTSSVHTSLGRDKVAFKVSLSVIVMNERALIKAIVMFPRDGKIGFSFGVGDITISRIQRSFNIIHISNIFIKRHLSREEDI